MMEATCCVVLTNFLCLICPWAGAKQTPYICFHSMISRAKSILAVSPYYQSNVCKPLRMRKRGIPRYMSMCLVLVWHANYWGWGLMLQAAEKQSERERQMEKSLRSTSISGNVWRGTLLSHRSSQRRQLWASWILTMAIPLKEVRSLRLSRHQKEPFFLDQGKDPFL